MALLILKTFLLKRGNIAYDGYRKVKGVKLSVLVDLQGLPLLLLFLQTKMTQLFIYLHLKISK